MLRFGRASAVAHPQDLIAAAKRFYHCIGDGFALRPIMRRIQHTAAIGQEFVKRALPFDVYGSIQNIS
jgi:hypothetical protein